MLLWHSVASSYQFHTGTWTWSYRLYVYGACTYVLLTKSLTFCRLISTLGNIIHQQGGDHWSHQSEIKFITSMQAGLSLQFSIVIEREKSLQTFPPFFMQPQVSCTNLQHSSASGKMIVPVVHVLITCVLTVVELTTVVVYISSSYPNYSWTSCGYPNGRCANCCCTGSGHGKIVASFLGSASCSSNNPSILLV